MLLTQRYADKIRGVLSCFGRVVIQGTLPSFCFAAGMAGFLSHSHIRIFDYPRFAEPLRDALRDNAEQLAQQSGFQNKHLRRKLPGQTSAQIDTNKVQEGDQKWSLSSSREKSPLSRAVIEASGLQSRGA